mmetsp:Transcript_2787/g.4370  ORF Transcript_2787/g.4370 Transcript_2787/m.4370 type:complete len:85 (-) Transcript_2787:1339-1593(-)
MNPTEFLQSSAKTDFEKYKTDILGEVKDDYKQQVQALVDNLRSFLSSLKTKLENGGLNKPATSQLRCHNSGTVLKADPASQALA